MDTPATERLAHRRRSLVMVRWALIALAGSLIVFSGHMNGRLGFAALLVLAVLVGRYGSRWLVQARRDAAPVEPSQPQPREARAPEAPARRGHAGH